MTIRLTPAIARTALLSGALALAVAACSGSPGSGSTATTGSKSTWITVGNSTGGPYTDNFNPLSTSANGALSGSNASSLIYEPLLQFDYLNPAKIYDWLASGYSWSDNDKTLTFNLRNGVKWSDGKPFTSADVVFTFNLIKHNAALNTNGIQFSSVSAEGPSKVVMTFASPSYAQFFYIGGTLMLPQHIWAKVKNPVTFTNQHPVGTGPFLEGTFNPQQFTLVRNPHYWQPGKPQIAGIYFPTYNSNTTAETYVLQGKFDWAAFFEPNLQQTFVAKNPDYHIYMPYTQIDTLVPNVTVAPLNNPNVREAISLALNRSEIAKDGESGYAPADTSPTGLVLPNDKALLAPQYRTLTVQQNQAKARQLLKQAGYTMGSNGVLTKGGKQLTLTIEDPSAFTNYVTEDQVIAANLKQVGIDVTVRGVSQNAWASDIATGHFDLTVHWSEGLPNAFPNYQGWLDYDLAGPIGKTASWDFGRWHDPTTQHLLKMYLTAPSDAVRTRAIYGLESVMVKETPVIPMCYIPFFSEYTTTHVTGWPSASDPYEPATPNSPYMEVVALRLTPKA